MSFHKFIFDTKRLNNQYLSSELCPLSITTWIFCLLFCISICALKQVQNVTGLTPALMSLIILPHFVPILARAIFQWITGRKYSLLFVMIMVHINLFVVYPGLILVSRHNPMTPMWAAYLFYVAILLNALGLQFIMLINIFISGMIPFLFYLIVDPQVAFSFLPVCTIISIIGSIEYLFIGIVVSRSRKVLVLEERLLYERRHSEEIKRIWSDIHDGIGSHLTMAMLSNGITMDSINKEKPDFVHLKQLIQESSENLKSAMSEMREAVRVTRISTEHAPEEIADYLRHKFTDAFENRNISLSIAVENFCKTSLFTPKIIHNVTQIIQESLTNILRHSNATRADLLIFAKEKDLEISVTDNGTGCSLDNNHQGSGLEIMRRRAHEIGGNLEIRRTEAGSVSIQLRISL